jgi:hypothetical protein
MADGDAQDLLGLDRDAGRGWAALLRWREAIARDPDAHDDEQPLESVRRVAGKSTWDALGALAPSAVDVPLRDALRRWVYVFVQARIAHDDDVAWARAASEARGRYEGDRPRAVSWRDAWRGVATSRTRTESGLWLDAAADLAPPLAAIARSRAERRVEVARRLGLEHPWSPLFALSPEATRRLAQQVLDATEDLSRAVWGEELGSRAGPAGVFHAAMGRDASEGWPARLTAHWIEDTVAPGGRGVRVELPALPAAVGAASFGRALRTFGFAVRSSTDLAGSDGPRLFALASEPGFVAAHRLGWAFGALPADAAWQQRTLGLGRRTALAQARVLTRTGLLEARLQAARVLLGDDAVPVPGDVFEEVTTRIFGAPLDARLRGAWPATRDDEPARLVALVQARSFSAGLRDRFDADWYRNPRAWTELRAMGSAPAHEPMEAAAITSLEVGARALGRAFEDALG